MIEGLHLESIDSLYRKMESTLLELSDLRSELAFVKLSHGQGEQFSIQAKIDTLVDLKIYLGLLISGKQSTETA